MPYAPRQQFGFGLNNRRAAAGRRALAARGRWLAPHLARLALWSLCVLGCVTAVRAMLHTEPLRIHGIEVRGLVRTSREALLEQAELGLHQPLLLLDLRRAVAAIEQLPWVRHATVRRQLPDRLRIEVVEHEGKAAAMLGELWLVNPDGEPFKRFSAQDRLVLPVITGVPAQLPSERPFAEQPQLISRLQEALALQDALLEVRDDLYNVDELHFDADLGWRSVLLLGRAFVRAGTQRPTATVHLGPNPQDRLPVLTDVLGQLADRHEVPEMIWANHTHQEGRVQVQLPQTSALLQVADGQLAPKAKGPQARRFALRPPKHAN